MYLSMGHMCRNMVTNSPWNVRVLRKPQKTKLDLYYVHVRNSGPFCAMPSVKHPFMSICSSACGGQSMHRACAQQTTTEVLTHDSNCAMADRVRGRQHARRMSWDAEEGVVVEIHNMFIRCSRSIVSGLTRCM